jgi:hypothetical protein
LWKGFKQHVCGITRCIREAASLVAEAASRPMLYLHSGALRKDVLIEDIRRRDGISEGLIAVLSAVEPCRTWFVRGSRMDKKLHLELSQGKSIAESEYATDITFKRREDLERIYPAMRIISQGGN